MGVATALLLVGAYSTEIADTDFWWHLRTGQYVVEEATLPAPDPFSYTWDLGEEDYPGERRVRSFNLTHEWLSQAIWYCIYAVGGFGALVLWKALLLAFAAGASGLFVLRRTRSATAAAGAALLSAPTFVYFAADRPALLTFALVPGFILLLERFFDGESDRELWALVPLQWFWANSHGGFFLGWVVLGAYFLRSLRGLDPGRRKRFWIIAGAAVAVSGLNPNGFRVVEVLIAYRQSSLTKTLIEWKAPPLWGPPYVFQALLYAAAAVLAFSWRRVVFSDALLFAAFAVAALTALRNITLIAFLAPALIFSYAWPELARRFPRLAGPAPAYVLFALVAGSSAYLVTHGSLFQLRVAEWKFPVGAARFLAENKPPGKMFNSYEYGGYLIWALGPEQQTFVDGRALNEGVFRDYRTLLYGGGQNIEESRAVRSKLYEKYDIGYVAMNSFEYVVGTLYPLVLDLADRANRDWALVYSDAQAVVFVRRAPENREWLRGRTIPKARVAEHLVSSCRTYVEHSPDLPNCARTLGMLLMQMDQRDPARNAFELYRRHYPYADPEVDRLLSELR